MSMPTAETVSRITDAAKRRVEGQSWAALARLYGYANEGSACTTLTTEHPEVWYEAFEAARTAYLADLEIEAACTQRELMQSYRVVRRPDGSEETQAIEPSLNQSAAHSLLNHTRQLRAQKLELTGPGATPLVLVLRPAIPPGSIQPIVVAGREQAALPDVQDALNRGGSAPRINAEAVPRPLALPVLAAGTVGHESEDSET